MNPENGQYEDLCAKVDQTVKSNIPIEEFGGDQSFVVHMLLGNYKYVHEHRITRLQLSAAAHPKG